MEKSIENTYDKKELLLLVEKDWQRIVNIVADIMDIKVALITKAEHPDIKIMKTNQSEDNPLEENEIFKLAGHYCEKVINQDELLEVNNSLKNKNWIDNPELEYGLISYLGLPIHTPDGDIFGTFCVLDDKQRKFSNIEKELLKELKNVIENQMNNNYLNILLNERIKDIKKIKNNYKQILNNMNDSLFIHEFKNNKAEGLGNFVEVNQIACQRLGYTKEELLRMSPDEIDGAEFHDSKQKNDSINKLERKGKLTFEAYHQKKSGDIFPVEVNSNIIKYEGKKAILSIARDITRRKEVEQKLVQQKEMTQTSLDSLSANIAVLDNEGIIRYTNQAWKKFIKENNSSFDKSDIGVNYLQVCKNAEGKSAREAPTAYQGIKEVMDGVRNIFTLEYPCHSPEQRKWFKMIVTPFKGEGPYKVVVAHENITKRKLKEDEVERIKNKYEKILETTNDGFFIINLQGEFLKVNESLLEMVGYNRKELLKMKVFDIDIEETEEETKNHIKKIMNTGSDYFETTFKTKNGNSIFVEVSTTYIDELEKPIFNAFIRDITERKKEEEKIKYLSFHDQLTGLYNRRYFEDTIARLERSRKLPVGVITADIDNLKQINDLYGHSVGDEYIKETAKVINTSVREADIVSRIGGDEFTVILPEMNKEDLNQIVNRIKSHINNIDIKSFEFDVSIGLAVKESYEEDLEDIIKRSDNIMYKKKKEKQENDLRRDLSILKNKERIVFEELPISLCFAALNGEIIEVNSEFCELLGYDKEELKQKNFFEITKEEDKELNKKYLRKIRNEEIEEYMIKKKYIKKNGECIDVKLKSKVIKDYKNDPAYIFAFIEEI